MKFFLFLLTLYHALATPFLCTGCAKTITNTNDPYVRKAAKTALTQTGLGESLDRVVGGTSQIVAGVRYKMTVVTKEGSRVYMDIMCQAWKNGCQNVMYKKLGWKWLYVYYYVLKNFYSERRFWLSVPNQ